LPGDDRRLACPELEDLFYQTIFPVAILDAYFKRIVSDGCIELLFQEIFESVYGMSPIGNGSLVGRALGKVHYI
jgi:hypothetical protein